MSNKPSFFDIHKDENYKNSLIDSLTGGITDEWMEYFELTLNYVINEKCHLFKGHEFNGSLYEGEDDILDLILPVVRRVFGKVFINPPKIFVTDRVFTELKGFKDDGRLELFRLHYDIDEFIEFLIKDLKVSKDCLQNFEYIDKSVTTLEIIVDNYLAKLVKSVLDSNDIKLDIRDLKLKKVIKKPEKLS